MSIALCVDQTSWVVDARVESVTDAMRTPDGFSNAVLGAYRAADLLRLAEGSARSGERAQVGSEILAGSRRISIGHLDRPAPITAPEGPMDLPPAASATLRRDLTYTGASRYREVTVKIRWDNGCVAVVPDPAWLTTTTASVAQTALLEAFAAAYNEGENL